MDTAGKAADHVTYCPVGSSLHLDSAINGNCDRCFSTSQQSSRTCPTPGLVQAVPAYRPGTSGRSEKGNNENIVTKWYNSQYNCIGKNVFYAVAGIALFWQVPNTYKYVLTCTMSKNHYADCNNGELENNIE